MILSHKIRIYPTEEQEKALLKACGCSRFAYNWGLEKWKELYDRGERPSAFMIKKIFNQEKKEKFPWVYDSPKDANQQPFSNLEKAFKMFFSKKAGYPKFKKRGINDSFYLSNFNFKLGGKNIYLPKIGYINLSELLKFEGKIMSATVSRTSDRWFVSIAVEVLDYKKKRTGDELVGIDLGIKSLAVLSTGEVIENPKNLQRNLKIIRRFSRWVSRKKKGSKNREKAKVKLSQQHYRVSCFRGDYLHKFTTRICRENQSIVIEDLNVKGMLRNRKLSKHISDASFGEIRRQLEYKSKIYDNELIVVDRWFPSSKTCSNCGCVKEVLKLSERTFKCEHCGVVIDRDVNAAKNLYRVGSTRINAYGQEGSGNSNTVKPCLDEVGTNKFRRQENL